MWRYSKDVYTINSNADEEYYLCFSSICCNEYDHRCKRWKKRISYFNFYNILAHISPIKIDSITSFYANKNIYTTYGKHLQYMIFFFIFIAYLHSFYLIDMFLQWIRGYIHRYFHGRQWIICLNKPSNQQRGFWWPGELITCHSSPEYSGLNMAREQSCTKSSIYACFVENGAVMNQSNSVSHKILFTRNDSELLHPEPCTNSYLNKSLLILHCQYIIRLSGTLHHY